MSQNCVQVPSFLEPTQGDFLKCCGLDFLSIQRANKRAVALKVDFSRQSNKVSWEVLTNLLKLHPASRERSDRCCDRKL